MKLWDRLEAEAFASRLAAMEMVAGDRGPSKHYLARGNLFERCAATTRALYEGTGYEEMKPDAQ